MGAPKAGGPAFPTNDRENQYPNGMPGMTLRDYFAAQALTGILACARDYKGAETMPGRTRRAYQYADEMLAAREAA